MISGIHYFYILFPLFKRFLEDERKRVCPEHTACGRLFFEKGEKISVFRNTRILVGEALLSLKHYPEKAETKLPV